MKLNLSAYILLEDFMSLLKSLIKRKFAIFAKITFGCTLILVAKLSTAEQLSPESQQLLEQLQDKVKVTLLSVSKYEHQSGRDMSDFYYRITSPAMSEANIGLSLDIEDINQGFTVINVAESSLASSLKIEKGDRILSVNGVEVNEMNQRKVITIFQQLRPNDLLSMVLLKRGEKHELSAKVKGRNLPEYSLTIGNISGSRPTKLSEAGDQCGVINVTKVPSSVKDIYSAYIINIDGRGVVSTRSTFKLPPGKHVLRVHELASGGNLSRRKSNMQIAKTLEIEVKPNMKYYLGAKFDRENRSSRLKEEYWKPVIWKISEQACQM